MEMPATDTVHVRHRFSDWKIQPGTETLIIGTFNPEPSSKPAGQDDLTNIFYGSCRNYLWCILPKAFDEPCLKKEPTAKKLEFTRARQIDFIDVILEVEVTPDKEASRDDSYLDKNVHDWWDVIGELEKLPKLKRACFTRKTHNGIPHIKARVDEIGKYLEGRGVHLEWIISPARYTNEKKQDVWNRFLRHTG